MTILKTGDHVEKIGGDYEFKGRIVAKFHKFNRELTEQNGPVRLVVQDDRGVLHVYSENNLRRVERHDEEDVSF